MPRKSGGKGSRARANRPSRSVARPSAVLPYSSASSAAPSPAARQAETYSTASPSPSTRPHARTYRPPRSGSLIPITDYSYVMADLRRIGVLAGAAFLILIGLTFVVH